MRIRTVKPEFWDDEDLGCVSRDARLLFAGTFNLADDEGLLRWNPSYIKSKIFMYDGDLDEHDVQKIMDELVAIGVIFPYVAEPKGRSTRQQYGWIIHFRKHQQINRPQPGQLPPPRLTDPRVMSTYARRDGWTCHLCKQRIADPPLPLIGGGNPRSGQLSLDHVIPRSQGGDDYPTNIRASHLGCNQGRSDRSIDEPAGEGDSVNDQGSFTERSLPEGKGREGKGLLLISGPQPARSERRRSSAMSDPPGFEAWWKIYPRKIGKGQARRAYTAATRKPDVTIDILVAAAERFAVSVRDTDIKFVPYPATWLNGERWADEPPARPKLSLMDHG